MHIAIRRNRRSLTGLEYCGGPNRNQRRDCCGPATRCPRTRHSMNRLRGVRLTPKLPSAHLKDVERNEDGWRGYDAAIVVVQQMEATHELLIENGDLAIHDSGLVWRFAIAADRSGKRHSTAFREISSRGDHPCRRACATRRPFPHRSSRLDETADG
jgi:hypothetical protein